MDGVVVVVVGASSGLGRATARAFAAHRAHVVLAARSVEALSTAEQECRAAGAAGTLVVPLDLAEPGGPDRLAANVVERFGRIDVWVHAAASMIAGPVASSSPEEVASLLRADVDGTYLSARAALQVFEHQRRGTLVNVSSLLGLLPNPVVPGYVMAKFAVRGLTLSLRQAVAGLPDVHVCLVVPGPIDTPLFQRSANHTGRKLRAIPPAVSVERVAAAVVGCARRPRRQCTAGLVARVVLLAHRIAPRPTELLVAQYSARAITTSEPEWPATGALAGPLPGPGSADGGWRLGRIRRAAGDRWGAFLAAR